jgi:hypothetical protein
MNRWQAAMAWSLAIAASCASGSAWSAAYRCEVDGKTVYGDKPCVTGRQSEVAIDDNRPNAEDRAAAAARLRSDKAAADAMQRDREKRERVERVPARAVSERSKEVNACAKLAVRARRAHEDYDTAGPRDQPKKRIRMLRADEDYATLCKKR